MQNPCIYDRQEAEQGSGLAVDGVCDPDTWEKLEDDEVIN